MKRRSKQSCLTDTKSFVIARAIVEEKEILDDELIIVLRDHQEMEIIYTIGLWLNKNERLDQLEQATQVEIIEDDKVYPERLIGKGVDAVIATASTWDKAFIVGIY